MRSSRKSAQPKPHQNSAKHGITRASFSGCQGLLKQTSARAIFPAPMSVSDNNRTGTAVLCVAFLFEDPDIGEIAVVVGVVQAVTDDELIRDAEAEVIGLEGVGLASFLFQETDGFERSRVAGAEEIFQVIQRQTGVDDVFHEDDMPAGDVGVDIFDQPDNTGAL